MEQENLGSGRTGEEESKIEKSGEMLEVEYPTQSDGMSEYAESEFGDDDLWDCYDDMATMTYKLHEVAATRGKKNRTVNSKRSCGVASKVNSSSPRLEETLSTKEKLPDPEIGGATTVATNEPRDEKSTEIAEGGEEEEECDFRSKSPNYSEHKSHGKKKLRMRTAREVIHRITWDPDLPAENFTVGYLDRFVGLVEKPFLFFDWSDIASVDYDVLAIPQHRIVYFKYREHKVWDKNQRVDLIFGSTENSKEVDIRELIQQIDDEFQQAKVDAPSAESNQYYDSDSDDDDVRVFLQCDDFSKLKLASQTRESMPNNRPNHFVAIRVTDPGIQENVFNVKRHLLTKEPRLSEFLMPDGALHITMAMLKLDGPAEIACAVQALELCREKLARYFTQDPPLTVALDGLATFNSNVLYARVVAPESFYELHRDLLRHLKEQGVQLAHEYDFVAHMTLLKLTRSRSRLLGCPYIDPFIYIEHKETKFGVQTCNNLHLCVIGEEKRFDGFYQSAAEVHFDQIA